MAKNLIQRSDVLVKFVKKANMFCRTWWNDKGEQKQEWSIDKPETIRPEG